MVTNKVEEPFNVTETEQAKGKDSRSSAEKEKSKVENKEFYKNMFKSKEAKSKAEETMSKATEFHVERRLYRPDEDPYVATVHLELGHNGHEKYSECTPSKQARKEKVQQTKEPVYADLGHPDEEFVMDIFRDDTVLWSAEQSHQDLHDVIWMNSR